ncbi:MAG: hypothetical protein WHF31_15200 [Candidatus Dehalobacter alkaniphilus]
MSAKINLKIYDDDEVTVIAEFETNRIRWGVVEDVVELSEKIEGRPEKESIPAMGKFIQTIFPKLTDALLRKADVTDITMCFKQIVNTVKNIEGAEGKNV